MDANERAWVSGLLGKVVICTSVDVSVSTQVWPALSLIRCSDSITYLLSLT